MLAAVAEALHDPNDGLGAALDRLRALGLGGTLDAEAAPIRLRLDEAVEDVVVGHRAQTGLRIVAGDEHALERQPRETVGLHLRRDALALHVELELAEQGEVCRGAPGLAQLPGESRTRCLAEAGPSDGLHAVVLGERVDVLPRSAVLECRQLPERSAEHARPHEPREGEAGRTERRGRLRGGGVSRRSRMLGGPRLVVLLLCRHQWLPSVLPPKCSSWSQRETAWGRCVTMNTVTSLMERIESSRRHSVSASSAEVDSSSTRMGAPL